MSCALLYQLKKFILDSGSGHDLIATRKVERMGLTTYQDDAVNFHTANGVTVSTSKVDLDFDAFEETANVHVLQDTPSVISMGKRCMDHGYSFVWPSGKDSYLVDKNANIIKITIKDYIPYISLDQPKIKGDRVKIQSLLKVLSIDWPSLSGENTMAIDGESGDELEDVDGSDNVDQKKNRKAKRRRRRKSTSDAEHEIAVGSDAGDAEEMECHVNHHPERCNLGKIRMEGLVPGGNGIQSRMLTFFNPDAPPPWDYRSCKITKSVDTRSGGYIVLYIRTETLFTTFNARLTDSGQVVTEHVIPFSFIRGGWYQDSQLPWVRLVVPSGPEQAIRTAIMPSHVASKESVLRIAHTCFASQSEKGNEEIEVEGLINDISNGTSPSGGKQQYDARCRLIEYILEKKKGDSWMSHLSGLSLRDTELLFRLSPMQRALDFPTASNQLYSRLFMTRPMRKKKL